MRFLPPLAASAWLATAACGGGDLGLPDDTSPAAITAVGGDGQSGDVGAELANPLVVQVSDAQGAPVAGVGVAFALGAGADGGSVAPDTAFTGSNGQASTRWTLGGSTGQQELVARVVDRALTVSFNAQALRSSVLQLELVSGDGQVGPPAEPLAEPLVVRLVDENGDGVRGRAVAWVVATGGGSANPESSDTDGDGFAATTWTLGGLVGANTLNAVVSGVGVVSFTATAVGAGGREPSAAQSSVSANPTSIQAVTGSSTITVTVRDDQGTPIPGAAVTLSATGSGNLLTQPAGGTGADGAATGTLRSTVPGSKIVSAVVNGTLAISQTALVTVTVMPAAQIALFAGDGQTAAPGTAVPVDPAVRVTNSAGAPVAGVGVTFVVTGGGGTITGASQTTNSNGVATVTSWTLGPSPGTNTLEARANGPSGPLSGSPVVFTATASGSGGVADRLVFLVQPTDTREDQEITPAVQVALVDALGNIVPESGVEIELDLLREDGDERNNRLDGERRRLTQDGIAVFPGLSVNRSDPGYRLRAQLRDSNDLDPVESDPFDIEP